MSRPHPDAVQRARQVQAELRGHLQRAQQLKAQILDLEQRAQHDPKAGEALLALEQQARGTWGQQQQDLQRQLLQLEQQLLPLMPPAGPSPTPAAARNPVSAALRRSFL